MKIFSSLEKGLSKAVEITGSVVSKIDEATEGWGDRADQFFDSNGFKDIKDKVAPVANAVKEKAEVFVDKAEEKVTEVVNNVKTSNASAKTEAAEEDEFLAPEDIVEPERVTPVEEVVVPVPVTAPVAPVTVAPVVEAKPKAAKKASAKKKAPALSELKAEAKELGIKGYSKLNKEELAKAIKKAKKNA